MSPMVGTNWPQMPNGGDEQNMAADTRMGHTPVNWVEQGSPAVGQKGRRVMEKGQMGWEVLECS